MAISFSLECIVASSCHLIYKLESIVWLKEIIMHIVMHLEMQHENLTHLYCSNENVFPGILVTSEILQHI